MSCVSGLQGFSISFSQLELAGVTACVTQRLSLDQGLWGFTQQYENQVEIVLAHVTGDD